MGIWWKVGTVIEVLYVDNKAINGYRVRLDETYNGTPVEYTVGPYDRGGIRPARVAAPAAKPLDRRPEQPVTPAAIGGAALGTDANCTYGPPPGVFSAASKPSRALFEREIYDRYSWRVDGTVLAPLAVGLRFISLTVGTPVTNRVSVVPGRGAQRINDAAPVNAQLYPITAKYIVCEKFRGEVQRTMMEDKWDCFIGRDGEWTCGMSDPLHNRITRLP